MVVLLCSPKVASHVVIETFSIMCNLREVNSRSCKIACRLLAFFLRVCALCAFWPRALAEHATRASCSQFLHFQRFHPRVACTHVHATDTRLRPFGLRVRNFCCIFFAVPGSAQNRPLIATRLRSAARVSLRDWFMHGTDSRKLLRYIAFERALHLALLSGPVRCPSGPRHIEISTVSLHG